jgi:hypothetical protein
MQRTNKNFREQTLLAQDNIDFIDELFASLTDNDAINSDTDRIPDLSDIERLAARGTV